MKKFSRCMLILIFAAILSGVGGYIYEKKTITPMYESVAQLYIVPGEENEASIRAKDGGLNDDFTIIFKSSVVIDTAKRTAGTSEDISQYITVSSPANSNIVEIRCVNPDQNTAKTYVDAVAKTALKTTTIIPVKSIQILSSGTESGVSFQPDLYRNTVIIMAVFTGAVLFIEILVVLFIGAFKNKANDYDDELEYERRYGRYAYIPEKPELIETSPNRSKSTNEKAGVEHPAKDANREYVISEDEDILADYDDEYDDETDEDIEDIEEAFDSESDGNLNEEPDIDLDENAEVNGISYSENVKEVKSADEADNTDNLNDENDADVLDDEAAAAFEADSDYRVDVTDIFGDDSDNDGESEPEISDKGNKEYDLENHDNKETKVKIIGHIYK